MKVLHNLSIDEEHRVIVFDNKSPSNYNRFITIVRKDDQGTHLVGHTAKEASKKEYKEMAARALQRYKKHVSI